MMWVVDNLWYGCKGFFNRMVKYVLRWFGGLMRDEGGCVLGGKVCVLGFGIWNLKRERWKRGLLIEGWCYKYGYLRRGIFVWSYVVWKCCLGVLGWCWIICLI